MNEYLTKPFAPEELFKLLVKYLDGNKEEPDESIYSPPGKQKASYSLEYISVKRKPEVIAHVLGIILAETPKLLQEVSNAITNEEWKMAHDKAHKLKSSVGLLQATEMLEILDRIERVADEKKPGRITS